MIKKVITAAAVALGLMAAPASASTLEEIAASTYMLYSGGNPHCSIVAISPTQFVTAHHCVEDTDDLNVRTIQKNDKFEKTSEEVRYLKVLRTLKGKDVAFLELLDPVKSMPNTTFVDVATPDQFKPKFGDPLIAVGYPKVVDLTVTDGEFTGLVELPISGMEGGFYKTTIPVTGGNSGGGLYAPVYPDGTVSTVGFAPSHSWDNYKLVGLTSAGYRDVSFMSYFSTVDFLKDVMIGLVNTGKPEAKTTEADDTKTSGKLIRPEELR